MAKTMIRALDNHQDWRMPRHLLMAERRSVLTQTESDRFLALPAPVVSTTRGQTTGPSPRRQHGWLGAGGWWRSGLRQIDGR
jgi:hypothetical protein